MKRQLSFFLAIILVIGAGVVFPAQLHADAAISSAGISTYRKILDHQRMTTHMVDNYIKFEDDNLFAMIDLDGNGREELITKNSSGFMASQFATVYTLSGDQRATVMSDSLGYYIKEIYRGGYCKINAGHNQGPSLSVWPFSVYRYQNGTVSPMFFAYSVDKKADVSGNFYKKSLDKDNDGVIYYIRKNDGKETPMTKTAFNNYVNKFIPKADKLTVKWRPMSEANISRLSAKMISPVKRYAAPKPVLKNTAKGVKISWKKSAGAAQYRVFLKSAGKWKKLCDTAAASFTHTAVKSGKKYTYTVRCLSANGKAYTSAYNTKGVSITCKK